MNLLGRYHPNVSVIGPHPATTGYVTDVCGLLYMWSKLENNYRHRFSIYTMRNMYEMYFSASENGLIFINHLTSKCIFFIALQLNNSPHFCIEIKITIHPIKTFRPIKSKRNNNNRVIVSLNLHLDLDRTRAKIACS